ncbi:MAG: hypothetical protein ACYDHM_06020 [Acidiferrobacterales bacterium]
MLRGKPQDLPADRSLLWQTALLSIASNFAIDNLHPTVAMRLLFASTQAVLLGAVVWGALRLRGFPQRWVQSIAPLYAAGALINLLAWPLFSLLVVPNAPASGSLAMMLAVGMTVWFLAVMTNVMHHALELPMGRSALVSIACLMFSGLLLLMLFPVPGMP